MFPPIQCDILMSFAQANICDNVAEYLEISSPKNQQHGDLCVKFFKLAQKLGMLPAQAGNMLLASVTFPAYVSSSKVVGGYINLRFQRTEVMQQITCALLSSADGSPSNGRRAFVEHTSITPHATPHVGHARNAVLGDTLARLLRFVGYEVEVHYFVNDLARQLALVAMLHENDENPSFQSLAETYAQHSKQLKSDEALQNRVAAFCSRVEKGDASARASLERTVRLRLEGLQAIFTGLNIHYDRFDDESEFMDDRSTNDLLAQLAAQGVVLNDEMQRLVADLAVLTGEHEMDGRFLVLKRSNGSTLYAYRELGYFLKKAKGLAEGNLNLAILGDNHKLHHTQLGLLLQTAGADVPEPVFHAMVRMPTGVMSTSNNNRILIQDVMESLKADVANVILNRHQGLSYDDAAASAEKIAVGIIRFNLMHVNPSAGAVFDIQNYKGSHRNGYFYVLNTLMRVQDAMKLAETFREAHHEKDGDVTDAAWAVFLACADFMEIVTRSAECRDPSILARHLTEVALQFNQYCGGESDMMQHAQCDIIMVNLCQCVQRVIEQGLLLLGIETPRYV